MNFRCTRVRRRQTAHGKVDGCEWYKIKLNLLCLMQAAQLIFHVFIIDHTFTWSLPFLLVRLFVMLSLLVPLTCFKVIYSRVKWENCEQRSLLMCFLFCFFDFMDKNRYYILWICWIFSSRCTTMGLCINCTHAPRKCALRYCDIFVCTLMTGLHAIKIPIFWLHEIPL